MKLGWLDLSIMGTQESFLRQQVLYLEDNKGLLEHRWLSILVASAGAIYRLSMEIKVQYVHSASLGKAILC